MRKGVGERRRGEEKKEGRERGGRNEKRGGRKEKRGRRMDKRTPCPPPLLWYSVFAANSKFSTQIFQILHITFVYSEGGMDRQGYASPSPPVLSLLLPLFSFLPPHFSFPQALSPGLPIPCPLSQ